MKVRRCNQVRPWRECNFNTACRELKSDLGRHSNTRLSIVLIGHTGAGKSALINSIYSISKGRIVDRVSSKSDDLAGVGTYHFIDLASSASDLFQNVHIFDTMGFTGYIGQADDGISESDLQAVCEGRVKNQHKFNSGTKTSSVPIEENIPKCVILVVSAEELNRSNDQSALRQKIASMTSYVPHNVARIAVITKVDRICDETFANIRNIYTSKKVHSLVKKAQSIFGIEENKVFPIVNFTNEMRVKDEKSIPILFALKFALNFASDRS